MFQKAQAKDVADSLKDLREAIPKRDRLQHLVGRGRRDGQAGRDLACPKAGQARGAQALALAAELQDVTRDALEPGGLEQAGSDR